MFRFRSSWMLARRAWSSLSPRSASPKRVCVTGATGFVASWIVEQLLLAGHTVVGTVRDRNNHSRNAHLLRLPHAEDRLHLVEANLLVDRSFDAALDGCDVLMHTASPFFFETSDPDRELIQPAVSGTRNVLASALRTPTLQHVILTSSVAAIVGERSPGRIYTENDWNNTDTVEINPYRLSKRLAENAAWDFVAEHDPKWVLTTICPGLVVGPPLAEIFDPSSLNTSNAILLSMFNGSRSNLPSAWISLVDVRDVARAHLLAMENLNISNGQRYICVADTVPWTTVIDSVSHLFPHLTCPSPPKESGVPYGFDSSKIRKHLLLEFTNTDGTLVDTMRSFMAMDLLPRADLQYDD